MARPDVQRAAWRAALRGQGRVVVDVGRVRGAAYVAAGILLVLVGAGLVVLEDGGGRVLGAVVLLLGAPMLVWAVPIALRLGSWRSPHVLVDTEGITVRHGLLRVPWDDLRGATATVTRYNRWVTLAVSRPCYDRWVAGRPGALRWLAWRRPRNPTLMLPADLKVDPWAFAGWLNDEAHERRIGEVSRLRSELDAAVDSVQEAARDGAEDGAEDGRTRGRG